jgi:predicted ATPase
MSTHPFLKSLRLKNLLSFGPEGCKIDLLPLNVLIGPNGSGKSNLIEAIGLLHSCATDTMLLKTILEGGGISEWIWKSDSENEAEVEAVLKSPRWGSVRHRLVLGNEKERMVIADEEILFPHVSYKYNRGQPVVSTVSPKSKKPRKMNLRRETWRSDESILVQRRDPQRFPEFSSLAIQYGRISIYRGWDTTRYSQIRQPSRTDLPSDRLLPDATNLSIVLSNILSSSMGENLERRLRRFHGGYQKITTNIFGGNVQIYLDEKGTSPISAYQMSDGFLRYLCLLAILCHPTPPPLICIEEPEIGLHPDMILEVLDLLVEASGRTQVIITTHSDMIVDRFTDAPENIVVFEKEGASSTMKRLDRKELKDWLKKYRLGQLWAMGHLGGSRW